MNIKLHILSISHKHGDQVTVHSSEEEVTAALFDWVETYWLQDGPGGEMPADRDAAIEAYFDGHEHESYWTDACIMELPVLTEAVDLLRRSQGKMFSERETLETCSQLERDIHVFLNKVSK